MGRRGPSPYDRMAKESGLLRPNEAARRLGVTYETFSALAKAGAIKATPMEWDGEQKMLYSLEMIDALAKRSASIGS